MKNKARNEETRNNLMKDREVVTMKQIKKDKN